MLPFLLRLCEEYLTLVDASLERMQAILVKPLRHLEGEMDRRFDESMLEATLSALDIVPWRCTACL